LSVTQLTDHGTSIALLFIIMATTARHFLFLIACTLPTGTGWAVQASVDWGNELAPQEVAAAVDTGATDAAAWPATPLLQPPAAVRAVYMNAWVFGGKRFYNLVALADTTEVNAFVIDIKDDTGYLTYRSSVPTAIEIGANKQRRARDTRERLRLLHAKGIYPIAAQEKMEWAVRHLDGGLWRDRLDFAWVDAYNDSVWIYAADLAEEAIGMGFSEVQFDYVRFPDEPKEMMKSAVFNARREGETTRNGVARNLRLLRDRMHAIDSPLTIDVFGMTASTSVDLGIGQVWEDLVTTADVVLPMVYPSHYYHSFYGISYPNGEPYRVVKHALEDALEKNEKLGVDTEIRPFLQAFTLRKPRYTPWYIREQIRAAEDLGIESWVLWNARGVYDPEIFRKKAGQRGGGAAGQTTAGAADGEGSEGR